MRAQHLFPSIRALVDASVRSQLSFRLSFILQALANLLFLLVDFVILAALVSRFGSIEGWSLAECVFLFFLTQHAYFWAEFVGSGWQDIDQYVRQGLLDRVLLRPVSPLVQLAAYDIRLRRFSRVGASLVLLFVAAARLHSVHSVVHIFSFAWISIGIFFLYLAILLLVSCASLRVFELGESGNILVNGTSGAAGWPLDIYKGFIRRVLQTVVPLWFVFWLPARSLLRSPAEAGFATVVAGPLFGIGLFLLARILWYRSLRFYQSAGG